MECRRSGEMEFAVGMVVRTDFNLTGVIVSWDLNFTKLEEWLEGFPDFVDLERGCDQPFYKLLGLGKTVPEGTVFFHPVPFPKLLMILLFFLNHRIFVGSYFVAYLYF